MQFTRILTLTLTILFAAISFAPHGFAEDNGNLVKIRLLPEKGEIKAGEEIWVGIEQSIEPHWHTYWQNPGDSGSKPAVDWILPAGFEVTDIEWPTPKKLPYGPLLNYGYEGNVILLQKLKAPETLPEEPIEISADFEILVCQEECIPEFGIYSMTLNGPTAESEDNSSYINAARAKLPIQAPWEAQFEDKNEILSFSWDLPENDLLMTADLSSIEFFPIDWGIVDNMAAAEVTLEDQHFTLRQKRGERPMGNLKQVSGVLAYDVDGVRIAKSFTASKKSGGLLSFAKDNVTVNESDIQAGPTEKDGGMSFLQAILWAFIGGLILNVMPCVFPVLSLKALSLVKISEKDKSLARAHGLSYTAGVVLSFVSLAAILIIFQAGGWGFHLQNPAVITALIYLMFVIGLNLIGVFDIKTNLGGIGQGLTQREGLSGTFFTGVLATVVATPCTAPFMAGAIGFAFVQPPLIALLIFAMLGFGLAAPYLLLSYAPALQKHLPKPGAWMETFRQFLAFPIFGFTVWLIWVLSDQVESFALIKVLSGMTLLAFGFWILHQKPKGGKGKIVKDIGVVLAFLSALGVLFLGAKQAEFSQEYSPQTLETLLEADDPIFVEMTATWCITCKVNHAIALNVESTRELFAEHNVQYLIGDWTNQDPQITKYLNSYGRNGVPIYVFYGERRGNGERPEPFILPQVLTPGIVANAIRNDH